ncbi:uncharacterized protein DC041_0010356 [Schistosoma bovis]|uniref:F-box and leucine-rich repeat protein 2/20 n=1 Tax=Schistosoma bovis TaxID=6184 RepID=A0A430QQW7_SCHBO|nr:uncharacterized protein DC041_0010356 [Schistosoma bovis]
MTSKSIMDVVRDLRRASNFRRTSVFNEDVRSIDELLNLIHHRSGSGLRCIELSSDLVTIPVLEELGNRCPNLRYLTLDFSNAMQLHDFNELASFPSSIKYLCICLSDVIFMEGLMRKIYSCLSAVEILHLIGTFELATEEEEEIYEVINISKIKAHTPNLRVINLFGINFIEDSHVELLASNCIHLECVALNFCLNVKGSSFTLLIANCKKLTTLLLEHCGLKDEFMMAVPWENSGICELDITSTELSAECLENFLTRIPYFTYLAAGHTDFFTDHILNTLCDSGKFKQVKAIDLSHTPALNEQSITNLLKLHGHQLHGLMLHGKATLAEYFWTTVIPYLGAIKYGFHSLLLRNIYLFGWVCVLGASHGWFYKYNTRVHIDKILESFAGYCPNLEALEIQWDPDTIRFSDKSRKFIDRIRIKCPRLKSLTLSDGKYYEMVKGNFERAECPRVVRTTTTYITSIISLLKRYKDLRFN